MYFDLWFMGLGLFFMDSGLTLDHLLSLNLLKPSFDNVLLKHGGAKAQVLLVFLDDSFMLKS